MSGADGIDRFEKISRGEFLTVDGYWNAALEFDRHFLCLVWSLLGIRGPQEKIFRRCLGRIFKNAAFIADVHQIGVHRIRLFDCDWNGDAMLLGVYNQFDAPGEIPLPPGSDNLQMRSQGFDGELEPDLIVSFAGSTMRDGITTFFQRRGDHALGNAGT